MSPSDITTSDENNVQITPGEDVPIPSPVNDGGVSNLDNELSSLFESKMAPLSQPFDSEPALPPPSSDVITVESRSPQDAMSNEKGSSLENDSSASTYEDINQVSRDTIVPDDSAPAQELSQEDDAQAKATDFQEQRRLEQEKALRESDDEVVEETDPLKLLRKGAIAAVGGTMVGLGLVMIPLPTPFGAVVASSGMAVLGTEFESAKELNQSIIKSATSHLESARNRMIRSIESMEEDPTKPDDDEEYNDGSDSDANEEASLSERGIDDEGSKEDDSSKEESPKTTLFMNPLERKRQEEASKLQQENAKKVSYYEVMRRRAGAYLNKNLVPVLKRAQLQAIEIPPGKEVAAAVPDLEASVDSLAAGTAEAVLPTPTTTTDDGSTVIVDIQSEAARMPVSIDRKIPVVESDGKAAITIELSKTGLAISPV